MAQTLKFGNKVWAAKEDSVLAYNDINNNYKPLPFSFSRASIGTRVNKDGLIETMGQDIARIDYTDSADGVLLLEPSRTNKVTYSEDFSQLSVGGNITIDTGFLAPDGSLNARKITCTDNSGLISTGGFLANDARTIYAKTVSGTGTAQLLSHNSNTNNVFTITEKWQRFELNSTPSVGTNFYVIDFRDPAQTLTEVILWGAQDEEGSYATSYIPTSGSTVTRAAETCNNSGNSEVFNDSEGVLFADSATLVEGEDVRIIGLSDGSTNNRISITYHSTENRIQIYGSKNGTIFNLEYLNAIKTDYNKIAIKYNASSVDFYYNGFLVDTEVPSDMFDANILNSLNFDRIDNNNNFYGKTKELGYYNTALTDAELETLTSYRNWVSMVNELNLNIIYNG